MRRSGALRAEVANQDLVCTRGAHPAHSICTASRLHLKEIAAGRTSVISAAL